MLRYFNIILLSLFSLPVPGQWLDLSFAPSITRPGNIRLLHRQPDGKILAAGNFATVNGQKRSLLVRLNVDGSLDTGFSPVLPLEFIRSMTVQPDGKVLVAGPLTTGEEWLLRLDSHGTVDPSFRFTPQKGVILQTMAVLGDGSILTGGGFNNLQGQAAEGLAILNPNGTFDRPVNLGAENLAFVNQISVLPDNFFLVCGIRDDKGFLQRFTPASLPDPAFRFTPDLAGGNFLTGVDHFAVKPNGEIVLSGATFAVRNMIQTLDPDGALLGFANFLTPILDLETMPSGQPLVAMNLNGIESVYFFAEENGTLQLVSSGTGADDGIRDFIVHPDGKITLAGFFSRFNQLPADAIVQLDDQGKPISGFQARFSRPGIVNAIAIQPDDKIVIGGRFSQVNQSRLTNLARLSANGQTDPGFTPSSIEYKNEIHTILLQPDGRIMTGGTFNALNAGSPYAPVSRLLPDGKTDPEFQPGLETNINGTVRGLVPVGNEKWIVFGEFAVNFGNQVHLDIARLNANGSLDSDFFNQVKASAIGLVWKQPDEKLILTGKSIRIGLNPPEPMVRLTPEGNPDISFLPEEGFAAGNVQTFTMTGQADGKLLLGGDFSIKKENRTYQHLVRLLPNGSLDPEFDAGNGFTLEGQPAFPTHLLPLPDGRWLITGSFDQLNSQPVTNLVLLENTGAFSESWITSFSGDIRVAAMADPFNLLLGGAFHNSGNNNHTSLAKFRLPETVGTDENTGSHFFKAGPNPVRTELNLHWDYPYSGTFSLSLFDGMGRPVWQRSYSRSEIAWEHTLPVGHLPGGFYLIQILTPENQFLKKIFLSPR